MNLQNKYNWESVTFTHNLNQTIMRKFVLGLSMMASLLLVSCSGGGPEGTVKQFVAHTSKGEFEEAKKYGTESTNGLLSMAQQFGGSQAAEMKEKNKDVKVDIISSDVKDSIATVKYKVTGIANPSDEEKELNLVKQNGDWKVDMKKEGMGGGAQ